MKYSTAKWIAVLLGIVAIVAISTYFFLDAKDMMISRLSDVHQTVYDGNIDSSRLATSCYAHGR